MTTRTEFLATLASAAAVPAAAASPKSAPPPVTAHDARPAFHFDAARFNEILAKPARHRQVFGAKKVDGGTVLYAMNNSIDAYDVFLKEGPASMHAVAVLYHGAAIALAMNDAVWNAVLFPTLKKASESFRADFADAKPGKGNPYLRSATSSTSDLSVQSLGKRGSHFFVCHNAIAGFAAMAAGALKEPAQKVHDAIMAGIVPNALVVPAGVMAINACQEAKFTYLAV